MTAQLDVCFFVDVNMTGESRVCAAAGKGVSMDDQRLGREAHVPLHPLEGERGMKMARGQHEIPIAPAWLIVCE